MLPQQLAKPTRESSISSYRLEAHSPTRVPAVHRTTTGACCHLLMVVTIRIYIRCYHDFFLRNPEKHPFTILHKHTECDSGASGWRSAHDQDMGRSVEHLPSACSCSAGQKALRTTSHGVFGCWFGYMGMIQWLHLQSLILPQGMDGRSYNSKHLLRPCFFFWSPAPYSELS